MADRRVYAGGGAGSNPSVLLQNKRPTSSSEHVDAFFLSGSSPSFLGSSTMVSFEDVRGRKRSNELFFCSIEQEENGDEDFDEYLNLPGKKRRLTSDQLRFLEGSFEVDNKLEPERKVQLAKDLNLQPRQVAIWFQNRRARWKSKQLEKDYDVLQARFDSLKASYDSLLTEKENLRAEVHLLTDKLHLTEKGNGNRQFSEATEVSQAPPQDPIAESSSEVEESKVSIVFFKEEDLNSAKSDVFESESPHYTDGGHCSSYVFEHDYHSDLSQDDEDNLSRSLLPPLYIFPKLEDADFPNPPANSSTLGGFPVEDHAIWSWYF